jgi:hypothetical protein
MIPALGILMLGGTVLSAVALDQRRRVQRASAPAEADLEQLAAELCASDEPADVLDEIGRELRAAGHAVIADRIEAEASRRRKAAAVAAEIGRFREAAKAAGGVAALDVAQIRALRHTLGLPASDRYDTEAAIAAQAVDPEAPCGEPIVPDGAGPLDHFAALCSLAANAPASSLPADGAPGGL